MSYYITCRGDTSGQEAVRLHTDAELILCRTTSDSSDTSRSFVRRSALPMNGDYEPVYFCSREEASKVVGVMQAVRRHMRTPSDRHPRGMFTVKNTVAHGDPMEPPCLHDTMTRLVSAPPRGNAYGTYACEACGAQFTAYHSTRRC